MHRDRLERSHGDLNKRVASFTQSDSRLPAAAIWRDFERNVPRLPATLASGANYISFSVRLLSKHRAV